MRAVQWKSCGKSPKLVQGYFLWTKCRISWRKDAENLDLRWSDRGSLRGDNLWGHGVRELSGQPSAALRSPEMEETTLSRLRVKYEVVTPVGDENILDWREIAKKAPFCKLILRYLCLTSGSDSYIRYMAFPYIFVRFWSRLQKFHIYSEDLYGIFGRNPAFSSNL